MVTDTATGRTGRPPGAACETLSGTWPRVHPAVSVYRFRPLPLSVAAMSDKTRRITYMGPPDDLTLLAQMLEEQGVRAHYIYRDVQQVGRDVLVDVTASGAFAAIGFVLAQFRDRMKGRATARMEDERKD